MEMFIICFIVRNNILGRLPKIMCILYTFPGILDFVLHLAISSKRYTYNTLLWLLKNDFLYCEFISWYLVILCNNEKQQNSFYLSYCLVKSLPTTSLSILLRMAHDRNTFKYDIVQKPNWGSSENRPSPGHMVCI